MEGRRSCCMKVRLKPSFVVVVVLLCSREALGPPTRLAMALPCDEADRPTTLPTREAGFATTLSPNNNNNVHMAVLPFNLPALRKLAVPSVCILIAFLAYTSQYLFYHLEPGPLTRREATWLNILVGCTWLSYERACRVDPGRLPKSLREEDLQDGGKETKKVGNWCKKCKTVKPPRAHHCRQCNR
jgi:hypothetical protein